MLLTVGQRIVGHVGRANKMARGAVQYFRYVRNSVGVTSWISGAARSRTVCFRANDNQDLSVRNSCSRPAFHGGGSTPSVASSKQSGTSRINSGVCVFQRATRASYVQISDNRAASVERRAPSPEPRAPSPKSRAASANLGVLISEPQPLNMNCSAQSSWQTLMSWYGH